MSVLRRLANAGMVAADAGGARAVPRPVFAPTTGVAFSSDAVSDQWEVGSRLDVAEPDDFPPRTHAPRREPVAPTADHGRSEDSTDGGRDRATHAAVRDGGTRQREASSATNEPRRDPVEPIVARVSAPDPAVGDSGTEPGLSESGDIASRFLSGRTQPATVRPMGPAATNATRIDDSTSGVVVIETASAGERVEPVVRPRSPGDASWGDRGSPPFESGGIADGPRSDEPSSANAERPIEVRIGTIEVFETATDAPVATNAHRVPSGFAEYAAVRSYDWGDHG